MNDEQFETMKEYFSEVISKQWFKRMEEKGFISKGTFDKFEVKFAPEVLEPEFVSPCIMLPYPVIGSPNWTAVDSARIEKKYGKSALSGLMRKFVEKKK